MNKYEFSETTDTALIRYVVMQPGIKEFLFEQNVKDDAPFNSDELGSKRYTFYKLTINEQLAGLVTFVKNEDIASVDVAILPEFRGKEALKFATAIFDGYSKNHKIIDFYARIRLTNKRSLVFCKWCGFSVYKKDRKFYYARLKWAVQ